MRALFVFLVACGEVATLPQPDAATDSAEVSAPACGVVAPTLAPKCNVRWGNGHYQNPRSVFMASNGDMIVTAWFQQTITIGSHTITPTDVTNDSTFVARFDSNCDIVWIRTISGSAQATAALPNDGLALMIANAAGHALLEIDSAGVDVRSRSLFASGSINTLGLVALTSDQEGSVYFAGILQGSTDLGMGIIGSNDGLTETQYIAKVDATGKTVFAIARDYAAPTGLAVNADGLWLSGLFVGQAPVSFDGTVLAPTSPAHSSDGLDSSFFVRLSPAGTFIDGVVFEHEKLWTVQADRCTPDLTTSGSSSGVREGVIARYDGAGHRVWTHQGEAWAELADGAGNLVVTTTVTPGFGFAVYDLDGSLVFERLLAKPNGDAWITAMAIASTGALALLGSAEAPSPGTEDGFLLRLE